MGSHKSKITELVFKVKDGAEFPIETKSVPKQFWQLLRLLVTKMGTDPGEIKRLKMGRLAWGLDV
jgi:hypothetical protein